jgi:hypothetical protein
LENLAGKWLLLVLSCMDEMAEVSSLASLRPMVVLARHSPIISNFDELIFNFLFLLALLEIGLLDGLDLSLDVLDAMLVVEAHLDHGHGLQVLIGHLRELLNLLKDELIYGLPLLFQLLYTNKG